MKKINIITVLLLIYLAVMASLGWTRFSEAGEYMEYFGILGASLLAIVLLRFFLIKKKKFREESRKKREASDRRCYRDDQIL